MNRRPIPRRRCSEVGLQLEVKNMRVVGIGEKILSPRNGFSISERQPTTGTRVVFTF